MPAAKNLQKWKVAELRKELTRLGLPTTGVKSALIARLEEARKDAAAEAEEEAPVETEAQEEEVENVEADVVIVDSEEAPKEDDAGAEPVEEKKEEIEAELKKAPMTEEEKRKKRAARFGIPVKPVKTSEEELKKKRAARFGLSDNWRKKPKLGGQDTEKLKARAMRFGTGGGRVLSEEQKQKIAARIKRWGKVEVEKTGKRKGKKI
mmetsp:Transcript_1357/g.1924  ORF Transcript_1357/g.1924 Transcript_1357/m.1924 type:complete len:207 (+) Transcript_1357:62-682(+)|eukprot:CAMPEP_0167757452 /NCGR_PEP_ID=MMETSP0110_2-20121227/9931_1 /TAXON_ID=629695 /ORGANISM="Gymnochlora sp., Strain CCMP2014" /LENGTH=206 /DNA_ID=CAMNT_0007643639 /DNA_START=55 /DNA_END=675 /DNA_ORIENTATION=-